MEKLCCSLQLAQYLEKLGVKQESEFYWCYGEIPYVTTGVEGVATHYVLDNRSHSEYDYSAFTLGELVRKLPPNLKGGYLLSLTYLPQDSKYCAGYYHYVKNKELLADVDDGLLLDDTPENACAKTLIYLLENNYITVDQVNK